MAYRFNVPPGWPVPQGWVPPPNWQSPPEWPRAPYGWQWWVEAEPTSAAVPSPPLAPAPPVAVVASAPGSAERRHAVGVGAGVGLLVGHGP